MTCNSSASDSVEEHDMQVDGFATTNGNHPSQGWTGECGDMDQTALLDTGTYSVWIR